MLVLEEADATHLCLIAAHYIPFLSFREEFKCSFKFHDIYCTGKEREKMAEISCLILAAG